MVCRQHCKGPNQGSVWSRPRPPLLGSPNFGSVFQMMVWGSFHIYKFGSDQRSVAVNAPLNSTCKVLPNSEQRIYGYSPRSLVADIYWDIHQPHSKWHCLTHLMIQQGLVFSDGTYLCRWSLTMVFGLSTILKGITALPQHRLETILPISSFMENPSTHSGHTHT